MTDLDAILIELHEKGNSRHNFWFNWNDIDVIKPGVEKVLDMTMTVSGRINTRQHRCDQENREGSIAT
jgi:hypothetical protein